MYLVTLNENLEIVSKGEFKTSYSSLYTLTVTDDELIVILKEIKTNEMRFDYINFKKDLKLGTSISKMFELLNFEFEHILLYIDVNEVYRKRLNSIIIKLVEKNIISKSAYFKDKVSIINYNKKLLKDIKKLVLSAKTSEDLRKEYFRFIYLNFNTYLPVYESLSDKYILHCPGFKSKKVKTDLNEVFNEYIYHKIFIDDNISLCTVVTSDYLADSPIIKQCNYNSIPLNTIEVIKNKEHKWYGSNKIEYILSFLKKCTNKYCLLLDACDTVILKDLNKDFIRLFDEQNVPFIFNSDFRKFPACEIEDTKDIIENKTRKYLNGGVVFGYTKELLKLYSAAYELGETINSKDFHTKVDEKNKITSEQFYLNLTLRRDFKELPYNSILDGENKFFLKCSSKSYEVKTIDNEIYLKENLNFLSWIPYEGIKENECNYLLL